MPLHFYESDFKWLLRKTKEIVEFVCMVCSQLIVPCDFFILPEKRCKSSIVCPLQTLACTALPDFTDTSICHWRVSDAIAGVS